jgi:hypothetical protein
MTMKQHHTTKAFGVLAAVGLAITGVAGADSTLPAPDGKPADMTKPVKVFILMGQSNMLGFGKIAGDKDGTLEYAVKTEKLYPFLVDGEGNWTERKDVRNVRVMVGRGGGMGVHNNEWLTIKGKAIGTEIGIGHHVGNLLEEPVMILKSCIGNRGLGWDLLPPGSEPYEVVQMVEADWVNGMSKNAKKAPELIKQFTVFKDLNTEGKTLVELYDAKFEKVTGENGKVSYKVPYTYAGYKQSPNKWFAGGDPSALAIEWYAGKQYDDDTANAKKVLGELNTYYPEAKNYEVAGFFWWQGDKDRYDAAHASRYELNLVNLIKSLRKDFNAPNAPFVLATLGQTSKENAKDNEKLILDAMMAVDGATGKYPEFKGNVATVYTHPLSMGGASNGHYNGNAKTYMNVGLAMGEAMVKLLKDK